MNPWISALLVALGAAAGALIATRTTRSRVHPTPEPDGYNAALVEGMRRLAAGQRGPALAALRRAAQIRTDDPHLFLVVGHLVREEGDGERAAVIHRALLARRDLAGPLRGAATLALARDELAAGHAAKAEALMRRAADESPQEIEPLVDLGHLLESQGRWDEAVDAAAGVRRLDRERGRTILARRYLSRGLEHLAAGDLREARRNLESSLENRPGLAAAEIAMGDLLFQEGRPEEAVRRWEGIIANEPERAQLVLDRLEEAHRVAGTPRKTRELALTAAERRPADWRVRAYLARAAIESRDLGEAERWLDELSAVRARSATLDLLLWRRSLTFGFDRERAEARARSAATASLWADPWVCGRCRLESDTFRWRCPGCRGWDMLV
jgi:lipopolysaccharide biosynthesis regulator YciM